MSGLVLSRRTKLGAGAALVVYTPPVASPLAWFDAGTESYSNGAAVPTATDRSGNARHATGANTPDFVTAAINGLPVYRFNGSNDRLQTAVFAMSQPLNLFLVGKSAVNGVNQYFCDDRATANSLAISKSAANALCIVGGVNLTGPALDTSYHIMHGLFSGASSVVRKGGGAGTTGNAGTAAPSGITLGSYAAGVAFVNGDIAEYLLYGALTTAQVNTVGNYLSTKYGLTWTAVP